MSASFGVPLVSPQDAFGHTQQAFGPPPGLVYPAGLHNDVVNDCKHYFLLFLGGRPAYGIPSVVPSYGRKRLTRASAVKCLFPSFSGYPYPFHSARLFF
jgi:hypothetical protein